MFLRLMSKAAFVFPLQPIQLALLRTCASECGPLESRFRIQFDKNSMGSTGLAGLSSIQANPIWFIYPQGQLWLFLPRALHTHAHARTRMRTRRRRRARERDRSIRATQVAQLLQDSAAKLQSQQLSALALRVLADPIDKVKELRLGCHKKGRVGFG